MNSFKNHCVNKKQEHSLSCFVMLYTWNSINIKSIYDKSRKFDFMKNRGFLFAFLPCLALPPWNPLYEWTSYGLLNGSVDVDVNEWQNEREASLFLPYTPFVETRHTTVYSFINLSLLGYYTKQLNWLTCCLADYMHWKDFVRKMEKFNIGFYLFANSRKF